MAEPAQEAVERAATVARAEDPAQPVPLDPPAGPETREPLDPLDSRASPSKRRASKSPR